jgi:hypothetical protein
MTTAERLGLLHRIAGDESLPLDCEVLATAAVADRCPVQPEIVDDEPATSEADLGIAELVELILKRPERLERLIRNRALQARLVPKLLAISLLGFVFFGVALALVFTAAGEWPQLVAIRDFVAGQASTIGTFVPLATGETGLRRWWDGSATALIGAYAIGLVAATGICLPSLYFYGLLAGVRMTMLDVVIQSLKAKATTAIALVGILPIYAALGLAVVVFELPEPLRIATFWLGLVLPFLAGLFGTYSLYRGLAGFADTLSAERRSRRECFLRRLVVSWAVCYTAVTPVMIHTLWVLLAQI